MWYIYPVKDYSRGMQISEFKGSLVYRVISRTARAIQGDPLPIKQNKTKQNKTKQNKTKQKQKQKQKTKTKNKKDHSAIQNEDIGFVFVFLFVFFFFRKMHGTRKYPE